MHIGIVGGTGKEGCGLALRWALAGHHVVIGSRDAARGRSKASELDADRGVITGGGNDAAVRAADVVVLAVPFSAHRATLVSIADELRGQLVIDITVPLQPPQVRRVHIPEGHGAALLAQRALGDRAVVASALHHVSAAHLGDPATTIDCDVLVCCDSREQRDRAMTLIGDLGLRAIDAGVLANSVALEALTPVLLHINRRYGSKGSGIRITGLPILEDSAL